MEIDNNNDINQRSVGIGQSEKVDDNKRSTKVCNKFSIDSILGLDSHNDDMAESNRLDLMDFYRNKGIYCGNLLDEGMRKSVSDYYY